MAGAGPPPPPLGLGAPAEVRALDAATGVVWRGTEQQARHPGCGPPAGERAAHVARGVLGASEAAAVLGLAEAVAAADWAAGGGASAAEGFEFMRCGQYRSPAWRAALRRVVDTRLQPYVRHRCRCPGAAVFRGLLLRHGEEARAAAGEPAPWPAPWPAQPADLCAAWVDLGAGGGEDWLLARPLAPAPGPGPAPGPFAVRLALGDVFVHQTDLVCCTRRTRATRYSLAFHFKDSVAACLAAAPGAPGGARARRWDAAPGDPGPAAAGAAARAGAPAGAPADARADAPADAPAPPNSPRRGARSPGGDREDPEAAVDLMRQAALQGHADSQRRLAEALLREPSAAGDAVEAFGWLQKAADQGDAGAAYLAAVACARGVGVPKDPGLALSYCKRGAELGHVELQFRLGVHLAVGGGPGAPPDAPAAAGWFLRAADGGHAAARNNLGVLLALGLVAPTPAHDLPAARACFEVAAAAGSAEASRNGAVLRGPGGTAGAGAGGPREGPAAVAVSAAHARRLEALLASLRRLGPPRPGSDAAELEDILLALERAADCGAPPAPPAPLGAGRPGGPPPARAPPDAAGRAAPAAAAGRGGGARCGVPRIDARDEEAVRAAVRAGRPALVAGGLPPRLAGERVLEFMPALMRAAGRARVAYEVSERGQAPCREHATLEAFMQLVPGSSPARACLMASDAILCRPELQEFASPPPLCRPSLLDAFPDTLRPASPSSLIVGGRGASCGLHRGPAACCTWYALVLGELRWRLLPPEALLGEVASTAEEAASEAALGTGRSAADAFAEGGGAAADWPPADMWEASQEMGDVLLIPPGWWQQCQLADRSLAVAGHYLTEDGLPCAAEQVRAWLSPRGAWPDGAPAGPEGALAAAAEAARGAAAAGARPRPDLCGLWRSGAC